MASWVWQNDGVFVNDMIYEDGVGLHYSSWRGESWRSQARRLKCWPWDAYDRT